MTLPQPANAAATARMDIESAISLLHKSTYDTYARRTQWRTHARRGAWLGASAFSNFKNGMLGLALNDLVKLAELERAEAEVTTPLAPAVVRMLRAYIAAQPARPRAAPEPAPTKASVADERAAAAPTVEAPVAADLPPPELLASNTTQRASVSAVLTQAAELQAKIAMLSATIARGGHSDLDLGGMHGAIARLTAYVDGVNTAITRSSNP